MLYVSIFVELLRSRPALAVWIAALAQAALWTLVPSVFYAGPPGDLPFVLAIGNELQLGTYLGPPLAFWLAEGAYILAGNSLFGVYLLSQICVVVTYSAVFALGRSIVGAQHAAMAVLLMVGISAFAVPTPDFGPVTLTMALWSVILLHYWRAVNEGKRGYWLALAVEIGLLFLTTYAGLLLFAVLALFTATNKRARAAMHSTDPWLASLVALVVLFPHLLWLSETGDGLMTRLMRLRSAESVIENFNSWLRQIAFILAAHAGLAVLVSAVVGWPWTRREPSPVIVREPVEAFARQFVVYFAIVPALAATIVAVLAGWPSPVGGIAPLVVLSGLAVVLLAGNGIELSHQHIVIAAWFGLLLVPPVLAVVAVFALPWVGVDLNVNKPVRQIAQFFADSFQKRTGTPLQVVAGDPRTAALISLGAPSRPSLFLDATPERTPWVTFDDVRRKGAIIVWPTNDTVGAPPPEIKERFPDLVLDQPRVFERPVSGRLPVLRYGWAVIRPQSGEKPPAEKPTAEPEKK
ncbi:MAG TPA: glycosyltransferase family 39 protein [Xanthobacteraceae bacterium]|nr:glycosyltransferase family 39 protein [Xanthobacteraceae bacterium]